MTAAQDQEDQGMVSTIGPLEVNWPQTVGYYGGISAAVAFGLIEPPVGLFIALVPFFKMMSRPGASQPERIAAEVLQGASKPVGGDASVFVRIKQRSGGGLTSVPGWVLRRAGSEARGIWDDAQRENTGRS